MIKWINVHFKVNKENSIMLVQRHLGSVFNGFERHVVNLKVSSSIQYHEISKIRTLLTLCYITFYYTMYIIWICMINWRYESQNHWNTYIIEDDFKFISSNGLNAVRIPVGWWIASNPTPKPYVEGSLQALDNAFLWAKYVYLHPNISAT